MRLLSLVPLVQLGPLGQVVARGGFGRLGRRFVAFSMKEVKLLAKV